MSYGFKIIVTGDYACFSRPEMKVERVSYDVPTPSALEGLIKSVYWKPAVRYQINKIVVFNPIRSQRAAMVLKNVKYGIEFTFERTYLKSDHPDESDEKHYNIMLRRLRNGQHFRQPCLGCREFAIKSIELVDDFDLTQIAPQNMGDKDLGFMLYGMKFEDGGKPVNNDWNDPKFSDKADAVFYRPHMIDGVIDVAKYREEIKC